jgi:hypothetical protein
MHQRASALIRRDRLGMSEGVTDLAQGYEAERGRQIEGGCRTGLSLALHRDAWLPGLALRI